MKTGFRLVALNKSLFEPLFRLNDEELSKRGMRRMTADEFPGYPCRVSLADAAVGEEVILLPYEHHAVDSPYRSGGPVFVRKAAETAWPAVNDIPKMFEHRLLSLRGYDLQGMMLRAEVFQGNELRQRILDFFGDAAIEYLHVHNAKPGCYNCLVRRA
jgi:hypothetical protein